MPGALAADDETAASRASASQATVTRLDTFLPETDLTDREALDVSLESHPEVSGNAVRVFEQMPYSTPVDRWWGINE